MKLLSSLLLSFALMLGASSGHAGTKEDSAITLSDIVIRATTPQAGATAAYGTIHNHGTSDDRLLGASVSFAKKAEIHEMRLSGDVMKMRPLAGGLLIPAGKSVALRQGAEHIMIMGLDRQIKQGAPYEIRFIFEQAGTIIMQAGTMSLSGKKSHAH